MARHYISIQLFFLINPSFFIIDNNIVNNNSISDELTPESIFHNVPALIPKKSFVFHSNKDNSSDDDEDDDDNNEVDEDDNLSILNESIPESIAHCLPNIPNTSINDINSNN